MNKGYEIFFTTGILEQLPSPQRSFSLNPTVSQNAAQAYKVSKFEIQNNQVSPIKTRC